MKRAYVQSVLKFPSKRSMSAAKHQKVSASSLTTDRMGAHRSLMPCTPSTLTLVP